MCDMYIVEKRYLCKQSPKQQNFYLQFSWHLRPKNHPM